VSLAVPVPASPSALRPGWLRPAALGLAAAIHAVLLGAFLLVAEEPEAMEETSYNVSFVREGEAAPAMQTDSDPDEDVEKALSEATQAAADASSEEAPKAKQVKSETPLALEAPKIAAADAVTLEKTDKRDDDPDKPTLQPKIDKAKVEQAQQIEATLTEKVGVERRVATEAADAMVAAASTERSGATDGRNTAMSAAAALRYSAKVRREIQRRMFYPRDARGYGVSGSAVVVFTIGADGRVIERHINRSTGNAALDRAALAILDAVVAPPPPLGRFPGKTTVKFVYQH